MMRRIETFYEQKPTVAELLTEDPTLFAGLSLPEGISSETVVGLIIAECSELQTIFKTAAACRAYLAIWSTVHAVPWSRMLAALSAEYNPIHNYDRTDSETISDTGSLFDTTTGSETTSGGDTITESRSGYNSDAFVDTDKSTSVLGSSRTTGGSLTRGTSDSRTRSLTSAGNIGVTTAQQMITAEIDMRIKFQIYGIIADAFRSEICVEVY